MKTPSSDSLLYSDPWHLDWLTPTEAKPMNAILDHADLRRFVHVIAGLFALALIGGALCLFIFAAG